ncbi:MAG: hypothetical protein R2838_14275 [Caldilineaceae bacterium]
MGHTASQRAPTTVDQTSARHRPRRRRRNLLPFALVIPIILYEGVLIIYPIAQGIVGSFKRIELASNSPRSGSAWTTTCACSTTRVSGK